MQAPEATGLRTGKVLIGRRPGTCWTRALYHTHVTDGADRVKKRRLYQARGVVTYWVVNPVARVGEVWHPDDERPEVATDSLTWRLEKNDPPVTIDLAAIFADLP